MRCIDQAADIHDIKNRSQLPYILRLPQTACDWCDWTGIGAGISIGTGTGTLNEHWIRFTKLMRICGLVRKTPNVRHATVPPYTSVNMHLTNLYQASGGLVHPMGSGIAGH